MSTETTIEPIVVSKKVDIPPEEAFRLFVDQFADWYPRAYTWAGEKLATIEIGSHEGARCFERGPHHFEVDWGRVLAYQPPEQLVFTWQISYNREPIPDPAQAGEVEVRFIALDEHQSTKVKLEHRKFEQHGEDGAQYRGALASAKGWPFILNQFKEFVDGG